MAEYPWPAAEKTKPHRKTDLARGRPAEGLGPGEVHLRRQTPGNAATARSCAVPTPTPASSAIDTSAAEKQPGVKAVELMTEPGKEIFWAGDEVVALAAVDETAAEDAARAVKIDYEVLPHFVSDAEPPANVPEGGPLGEREIRDMFLTMQVPAGQIVSRIEREGISFTPDKRLALPDEAGRHGGSVIEASEAKVVARRERPVAYKRVAAQTQGEPDKAFAESEVVVGRRSTERSVITHCCLETHGAMSEWTDPENLSSFTSRRRTFRASRARWPSRWGSRPRTSASRQDHIGGGFGSKFGPDSWGIVAAKLSKKAGGKPVKIMLERDAELAGRRRAAFRLRASQGRGEEGRDDHRLGVAAAGGRGGIGGGGARRPSRTSSNVPNQRKQHTAIANNIGSARAWRAPNHPQACLITMAALEDLAAELWHGSAGLLPEEHRADRPAGRRSTPRRSRRPPS